MKRSWIAASLVATLALTACGSDDKKADPAKQLRDLVNDANELDRETNDALDNARDSLDELPDFKPEKAEFKDIDSTIRVANFFYDGEEGVDLTLFWGDKDTGKKIAELPYGEVTDELTIEVEDNPLFSSDSGEDTMRLSYYRTDTIDEEDARPLFTEDEDLSEPTDLLLTIGWSRGFNEGDPNVASNNLAFLSGATPPTDGTASVILFDGGSGDEFIVIGVDGDCSGLPINQDVGIPSAGAATTVPVGSHEIYTYAANSTECDKKSETTNIDLAENDLWILWVYGPEAAGAKVKTLKVS